jgi:hypothetical protein
MTHLGLGDMIITAPLAVYLSEQTEIAYPSYPLYKTSVESFFVNHPRISVYTVPEHRAGWHWGCVPHEEFNAVVRAGFANVEPIRTGIYLRPDDHPDFSRCLYSNIGVPWEVRYRCDPLSKAAESVLQVEPAFPNERKIFLHDDPRRAYRITRLVPDGEITFRPNPDERHLSVLRYAKAIYAAKEVHVIDSAFYWLVDSLLTGTESGKLPALYLHAYVRWPRSKSVRYGSRLPWKYLF